MIQKLGEMDKNENKDFNNKDILEKIHYTAKVQERLKEKEKAR
jgi:hypothetical protein